MENLKNIGEHLKRHRLQLYLKQADVAMEIGVSKDCITYWENNRSQPQIRHYPKIIMFLGYNPFIVDDSTLGGKIKKYRIEHGYSIKRLAQKLKVEERTLVSWEENEVVPKDVKYKKLKELIF
ncbi:MAG: transcriptional regulator [Chitinophagales bacterium]|nr:transcriptional regulator [Chitinophagales bacterium]